MSETNTDTLGVSTSRVFVNSELARKWMRLNIENNRPISEDRISMYARDMKSGRWRENGDTIKFAEAGSLIDGQHRLMACIQCGIGFWSQVARGIKREAFLTIDRNQTRTTGQVLHMAAGVKDYNVISGTLTWLWRFRDGIVLASRIPTPTEAAELLEQHPQLKDSVSQAHRVLGRFKAGACSVVALCHYCFTRQDATLAEAFFDALAGGANLRDVDPVYHLRAKIISSHSNAIKRIFSHEMIALYFKTWIAEKEQRTVRAMPRWQVNEPFPNIGPITEEKHRPEKIVNIQTITKSGRKK